MADEEEDDFIDGEVLEQLEVRALTALVQQAAEGNATAASSALVAVQRIREKGAAFLHRSKLGALEKDGVGMAAYLSELGLTLVEAAARMGRKLTKAEESAWAKAQDDRLLEVRAVELQRMRVSGDVPKWANRRH
jgi:hypothetical protein